MKHYPQFNYSVITDAKKPEYIDFDIVALEGPCKVIAERDEFYGGKKSKPYEGKLLINPTWGQLFIEAMKQQQKTLNFHHIFLEGGRIGNKMAKFSMATDDSYKDKEGTKIERAYWHNIIITGGLVNVVENYVNKGQEIAVEGKITNRSYETKEGEKRYVTEILVSELLLLGSKQ